MTDAELVTFVKALCAVGGSSEHVVVMERIDRAESDGRYMLPALYRVYVEVPGPNGTRMALHPEQAVGRLGLVLGELSRLRHENLALHKRLEAVRRAVGVPKSDGT